MYQAIQKTKKNILKEKATNNEALSYIKHLSCSGDYIFTKAYKQIEDLVNMLINPIQNHHPLKIAQEIWISSFVLLYLKYSGDNLKSAIKKANKIKQYYDEISPLKLALIEAGKHRHKSGSTK